MPGRNLFESYYVQGKTAPPSTLCVFISHNSKDKPFARSVARALVGMGIDIYFDENDTVLRAAVAQGHDKAIVACIEDGLNRCTHLLGLISPITFDSWWVPYEIGGANGRSKECAHLVSKNVTKLPSYVKVARLLMDQFDLRLWLAPRAGVTTQYLGKMVTESVQAGLDQYVAGVRAKNDITFVESE